MKKAKSFLVCFLLILCCGIWLPKQVYAAGVTATLTGTSTVRAGDTITVTLKISGGDVTALEGSLQYDKSILTLKSIKSALSTWELAYNDPQGDENYRIVAHDPSNGKNAITKSTSVVTVTFYVKTSVATGTKIKVSLKEGKVTTKTFEEFDVSATYEKTIAAPLSTNCNLKSLKVEGLTLSPAFKSSTVNYDAGTVPFSTSSLKVTAVASDSTAKVTVGSTKLSVGKNTIYITVKAQSGATKTYAITVTREQDPNYVKSDNSALSGITVQGYVLSPVFTAENTQYVVWLPYETGQVTVTGKAADSKAQGVEVSGGSELVAGEDNIITVTCTAEDGTTTVYTVIAKRAAAHGTSSEPESSPESEAPSSAPESEIPNVSSEPDETVSEPTTSVESAPTTSETNKIREMFENKQLTIYVCVIVACIVLLLIFIGMLIGYALSGDGNDDPPKPTKTKEKKNRAEEKKVSDDIQLPIIFEATDEKPSKLDSEITVTTETEKLSAPLSFEEEDLLDLFDEVFDNKEDK